MKTHGRTHWNYRVVTRVVKGMIGHDLTNGTTKKFPDERVFSIVEVYYNKDGNPNSYVDSKHILKDCESKGSLKWILKKAKKAFKKPILDLDHFPQKYYPNTATTNDQYS
jgi:hypothetical protein